jgi:CBS domain containing-hemolysin-like protein
VFGKTDLEHLFDRQKKRRRKTTFEHRVFENALELPKIRIRQSLVPRKEIVGIDIKESIDAIRRIFIETKLSRIVVFEGNIDHIIGYVHQLDMFKRPESIQSVLLPIPAVPESMSATDLINKFTRERKSIAWVVDEFGGTPASLPWRMCWKRSLERYWMNMTWKSLLKSK